MMGGLRRRKRRGKKDDESGKTSLEGVGEERRGGHSELATA